MRTILHSQRVCTADYEIHPGAGKSDDVSVHSTSVLYNKHVASAVWPCIFEVQNDIIPSLFFMQLEKTDGGVFWLSDCPARPESNVWGTTKKAAVTWIISSGPT